MSRHIVITGTDTGIGKTVFSAALTGALNAFYWKPIQSGLEEETDTQAVLRLSGIPSAHVLPELYRLNTPASPHLAAEIDGVVIDLAKLVLPVVSGALVVEGAGGLMVPLTRETTYIDQMARWGAPVVLCARTALGTINHTLLSIEALRRRKIPLARRCLYWRRKSGFRANDRRDGTCEAARPSSFAGRPDAGHSSVKHLPNTSMPKIF